MDSVSTLIENIAKSFQEQFSCSLDPQLFAHIIEKELIKKKEAFLQVQISHMGLDVSALDEIKNHLNAQNKTSRASLSTPLEIPHHDIQNQEHYHQEDYPHDLIQESSKRRGRRSKTGIHINIDESGMSEEEILKAKRREYARQYYAQKKKSTLTIDDANGQSVTKIPSRRNPSTYKTSEDQRRYQREYYRRKKAATKAMENQMKLMKAFSEPIEKSSKNSINETANHPSIQNPLVGHQNILENHTSNGIKSTNHDLLNPKDVIIDTPMTAVGKKPFVEYDKLVSDRLAIDNAFRFEKNNPDGIEFENLKNGETQANSLGQTPRTKLRKNRTEQELHHS